MSKMSCVAVMSNFAYRIKWFEFHGQVVSELGQAPASTAVAGIQGLTVPYPMAGEPGLNAKFVPAGCVASVPGELNGTFTHCGLLTILFLVVS
jgi:hypothetical protein